MYYLVRRDKSHMRLYEDTVDLLCTHHLKTAQDVIDYQKEAMKQIDENYAERQKAYAYLRKAREKGDLVEADKARYNVGVYTMRLSKLRREVTTCDEEAQRDVVDLIDDTESFPSHDQAIRMRKAFEAGKLDYNVVDDVMREEKPNQRPTFRIRYEDVKAYFKPTDTAEKVLKDILQGLQLLKRQRDKGAR